MELGGPPHPHPHPPPPASLLQKQKLDNNNNAHTRTIQTSSINNTNTNTNNKVKAGLAPAKSSHQCPIASTEKTKCPSLLNLCLGILGKHFEDIIQDLGQITAPFPPDTKMAMMAIARRRKLLSDGVLIPLADCSWHILDISSSDVSDLGLKEVVKMCQSLRAVDISRCSKITAFGVSELLSHCHSLETLRCGGCPASDAAVRRCLGILKPKLNDVAGESWEELDSKQIASGAESLRWLLWPKIDDNSRMTLATECPRIIVNPKPSLFSSRVVQVPNEAMVEMALDESFIREIDPKTWAVPRSASRVVSLLDSSPTELPIAERFRLAFIERDERLAPKRAKNERQHRRRAEREWMRSSAEAKSVVLASKLGKSLHC